MQNLKQTFKRGRAGLWTRDKIEPLSTPEVRQLMANAVRLGETELATLCDEILGSRPRGRVLAAKPRRKRVVEGLVSRSAALGMRGVVPRNRTWSRSGVRESDGGVVMALWADDVRTAGNECSCLLWAPNVDGLRAWSNSPGGSERLAHCRLAKERGEAEGLLAYGVRLEGTLPDEKVLHLDGVDAQNVISFRVEQRAEEYGAVWDRAAQGAEPRPVAQVPIVETMAAPAVSSAAA